MEMIDLNINGSEVLIKGMENLPLAFRDVYNGKYMGKPIVEFEHNWKWEIDSRFILFLAILNLYK